MPSVMGPVQSMGNFQTNAPSKLSATRAWLGGTDKSWQAPPLALSIPFHRLSSYTGSRFCPWSTQWSPT